MRRVITIWMMILLATGVVQGQITIGGNVYGGGNAGETGGRTTVTVRAGDINAVFGGARMANVNGSAFVNIDGENATGNIFINTVYGGNDIAGTIGLSYTVPSELSEIGTAAGKNNIDNTWNAFVRTTPTPATTNAANRLSLVIGSLFGGGNGDYGDSDANHIYTTGDYTTYTKPVLGKTYLEILGGCIAHLYGGGNNATITSNTTICIDNDSPVLTETNVMPTLPANPTEAQKIEYQQQLVALATRTKLVTFQSNLTSYAFNFARVFGGNNKAEMNIRPIWNLQKGVIRDLYSGGNQGAMTSSEGLLLDIDPQGTDEEKKKLVIENVYGGCRMADVHPLLSGTLSGTHTDTPSDDIQLSDSKYKFSAGLAARVLVRGGDINNVYGGNDITGKVYGGNAIGIYTTIRGNVYGGGNGSYAYTDNETLGQQEYFKDFYYGSYNDNAASVAALNAYRPNAEQVSIRLKGESNKPTVILGSVYCGGNSASIMTDKTTPTLELKIGSHVIANEVFLGNNGANMVNEDILKYYAGYVDNSGEILEDNFGNLLTNEGTKYSSLQLTDATTFSSYMDGVAMNLKPSVLFDETPRDPADYISYSSYIGSFFCGGNVGSMTKSGKLSIDFNDEIIIYNKVVGGCNNANVTATDYNAAYEGGLTGDPDTNGDKLELNFGGLKIQPMRWKKDGNGDYLYGSNGSPQLEWNTVNAKTGANVDPITTGATTSPVASTIDDLNRRLKGGNVYGGCYNSGHVNGNVVINLNATLHEREKIFDVANNEGDILYENVERGTYQITKRNSGVILSQQGMDVLGAALNVFGGGYGENSEVWGSATINLNKGYTFQIFGGGEQGAIGKGTRQTDKTLSYDTNKDGKIDISDADAKYSTYINLNGVTDLPGVARNAEGDSDDMAECEFIYGGAFEGLIAGDIHVNLDNGRIFNSFAGSCNADVLGHTETYVGQNGFPWIRDHIYGGNDLGGKIFGHKDYTDRIRNDVIGMVNSAYREQVKNAASYMEYTQGRVRSIFGGSFGDYDYTLAEYKVGTGPDCHVANKPYLHNTFVNIRPNTNASNEIAKVFGAGEGYSGDRDGDKAQDHSYILVDIPTGVENFANTEIFGAGAYNGLGMRYTAEETFAQPANESPGFDLNEASAIIDLMHGHVGAAYGGSYEEGITRRTIVNVPEGSTIKIGSIFGGAYGSDAYLPCDVYEANVNYLTHSEDAYLIYDPVRTDKNNVKQGNKLMKGAIYGGNNYARRTLYGKVNISAPVKQKHYLYTWSYATVYGAGCGSLTWNEYTEVNLNDGAKVWEVYGGGQAGGVMSAESAQKYIASNPYNITPADKWKAAWSIGSGYDDGTFDDANYVNNTYAANDLTNLNNPLVRVAEIDDRDRKTYRYNTNVIIHKGAYVGNYAYGGGLGNSNDVFVGSGDVYGTTYIALLGGKVNKDLYAAGTSGGVYDAFGVGAYDATSNPYGFTASATAYLKGGSVRNVYGGGWEGSVGKHQKEVDGKQVNAEISYPYNNDIYGETHVVIGIPDEELAALVVPNNENENDYYFYNGIPTIQRNAYGGGEGGPIYGDSHITLNNGYIGYEYVESTHTYGEKIVDETVKDNDGHFVPNSNLNDSGCIFGGGYVDNSSVDVTHVKMFGGEVRNALFGGGEIAAIGRGSINASGENNSVRTLNAIYKAGKTNVELYGGHVHRNVFGGGRGYNNLGKQGTLFSDGYVFGQTEVNIFGGEIGTTLEMQAGNGNVFGGGDIGYVYSAYEKNGALCIGKKSGTRYDDGKEGYYYQNEGGTYTNGVYNGTFFKDDGEYVPTEDCKVLVEPHTKVREIAVLQDITSGNVTYYKKDDFITYKQFREIPLAVRATLTENTDWRKNTTSVSIDTPDETKATTDANYLVPVDYAPGEYVPMSALNTLQNKNADKDKWKYLDDEGVIIHNAVFAGGNTSSGSVLVYANATSVFGNVTASIHDAYHRDLITLGTGHIGGLYGDGNLTFVDGYRGLNITNYGTDYYSINKEVTIDEYHALPDREAAYYELKYKCLRTCTDKDGTRYTAGSEESKASTITADDLLTLFLDGNESVWVDAEGNKVPANTQGAVPILAYDETEGKWIPNSDYWQESGVLPVYAGRLMNSIQRADFCGVFGSRMVMQGAQDRVPEIVDFTNYTINRVREVSLNRQWSLIASDKAIQEFDSNNVYNEEYEKKHVHGNYFGIYNIVNYLGALTSDVYFTDKRWTKNNSNPDYKQSVTIGNESKPYLTATYYDWKQDKIKKRSRNNGSSFNKVALASGVYLELTSEQSAGNELYEKDWGYITGIIELDLINVQTGIGGGFVYAKNEHGKPTYNKQKHTTLTALNKDAVTRKDFTYSTTTSELYEWETSGNFVHSTQTIIDDCYNISGKYSGNDAVPAHYWYIKGSVYVYDQYISAYTGAPNAYSETVDIPLTITAASHGTMKLLDVQPNLYAYYSSPGVVLEDGKKVVINDVTYYKNDPISYWDYYKLSQSEKGLFVPKTYVTIADCMIGSTVYPAGTVMLPGNTAGTEVGTYWYIQKHAGTHTIDGQENVKAVISMVKDDNGDLVEERDDNDAPVYKAFDFVFRESNNISHDTGYMLTYKVNNPTEWDTWYTEKVDNDHDSSKAREKNQTSKDDTNNYDNGPTFRLKDTYAQSGGGVLGQRAYIEGNLISKNIYDTYKGSGTDAEPEMLTYIPENEKSGQATFGPAYIVTQQITYTDVNGTHHLNPGAAVSETVANANSGSTSPAYICTSTVQLSKTEFIYLDTKMSGDERTAYITGINTQIAALGTFADPNNPTQAEINALSDENKKKLTSLQAIKADIEDYVVPAYYCLTPGLYGGNHYVSGRNYRGLEVWSSMSRKDREKFDFNYDAFDVLLDPGYSHPERKKYQYDQPGYNDNWTDDDVAPLNLAGYSVVKPVNYTATYHGTTDLSYVSDEIENNVNKTKTATDGTELSRSEYERLPNEQRHYAPITPKADDNYKVYVVNSSFQIGNTPYAVGQTITPSEYSGLGNSSDRNNVTVLQFSAGDADKTFYYCREGYVTKSPVQTASGITIVGDTSTPMPVSKYAANSSVPLGTVIGAGNTVDGNVTYYGFTNLPNQQKNFTIHGIAPTETSTLYVSRFSDIFDLSTEKIITVIYQYDYEESDASGNITPLSERHVVNIHLQFKSGVPSVEDIKAPQIIKPGDFVGLREPNVTPGAYEVTGGGWELFEKIGDAESHTNGIEFTPNFDPLYWYQDGWYVAYYAKTYLGKSYSNHEQVSVANYHDLKKVMEDQKNHYFVDNPNVKRESKIYIEDYSKDNTGSTNGLDVLKSFFDLSVLNSPATNSEGLINSGDFTGHKPLDNHVRAGRNLDFILRTDIDHSGSAWTPIGNNNVSDDPTTSNVDEALSGETKGECFDGTLHGDGHHLSGLTNSLFAHLCGNVYNLGVSGSFTGGGIADEGDGYAENCWVSTTGTPAADTYAIFGKATEPEKQIENCYYLNTNTYKTTPDARPMPAKAFYNGTVAYNLNSFYLHKRYYQGTSLSSGKQYDYITVNDDGTLSETLSTGYYPTDYAIYPLKGASTVQRTRGYVENRIVDGDFRFAAGAIPQDVDIRLREKTVGNEKSNVYAPIWPDDYLFFGQALNYDYMDGQQGRDKRTHEDVPSAISRSEGRVLTTYLGNRVYRAPAYFGNSKMGVAHFNQYAVLAATKKDDPTTIAYKGMTAIDFTGHNDVDYAYKEGWQKWSKTSVTPQSTGMSSDEYAFFPPLLDDDGLQSFRNMGLTQNLLVYTAAPGTDTAAGKTGTAVSSYLTDETYAETNSDTYRTVPYRDPSGVNGHWVKQSDNGYVAIRDHFLVDRQAFNAPMAYTFNNSSRMWYQRLPEPNPDTDPDRYVSFEWSNDATPVRTTKGWDCISIPFKADIVTTQDKGELTHFYGASTKGHEYWLRQLDGLTTKDTNTLTGNFNVPAATGSNADEKTVTNDFLWDYYYQVLGFNQQDKNNDTYQEYYQMKDVNENGNLGDEGDYVNKFEQYPRLAEATPYIIGFPGPDYYEFDLSGTWKAQTTADSAFGVEDAQYITFASETGVTIDQSDASLSDGKVEATVGSQKYVFWPVYGETTLSGNAYVLNDEGSSFDVITAETQTIPFRPYFANVTNSQQAPRRITFNSVSSSLGGDDEPKDDHLMQYMEFSAKNHAIVVTSHMLAEADVSIFTVSGVCVASFNIAPDETVETPIYNSGVYIIRAAGGHYTHKVTIK